MKRIVVLLTILAVCQFVSAQSLRISGRIISNSNTPVEYASVVLQTKDSVFITGGVSDLRGRFTMENLKAGQYNLQISCIGYQTKNMFLDDFTKNVDLGTLEMDSTAIALDEVTITANNVINKQDRKIILPTALQLHASTDGLTLLQQMKLSRIQINLMDKKISASGGGDVQIRINGAPSNVQEVLALRPEDILRIEYHDDPGVRYGNVEAVLDYITRRHETGGYVSVDLDACPYVFFTNQRITAKVNHKKSEFGLSYNGGIRAISSMWRENSETFNYGDGTSFTRVEDGMPDKWYNNWNYATLNYNYMEPDKSFLSISLRENFTIEPIGKQYFHSLLYPAGHPEQAVDLMDKADTGDNSPSLDIYYQRSLKKEQNIIFNVVGTYINSRNRRTYQEMKNDELVTDIYSDVKGKKYSIIGEGVYEKGFKVGRLSLGVKHTQSFTNNEYMGSTDAKTKMEQSETYVYTEFQGKADKFNYSLGVGGTRSWFSQEGEGYQNYTFRPSLKLAYNFNEHSFIRYRGDIYSSAPSLSDLNNVEQLIDSLQIRRGNPNLKPVLNYVNSFVYDYHKGLFSTNLNVQHWFYHKPIMEETILEGDKFIRTVNNQKSWQKLNTELELKFGPIKNILTVSLVTGFSHFDSRGNNYRHTYNNLYFRGEVMASYKNWMGMFQIQSHKNNFWGETLSYEENYHVLGIMYRHKNLNVGAMMLNPFVNNWKVGKESRNEYAPSKNWTYVKDSSRLAVLKISYSFSFGRKYESGSKRLNNEDNDSGILNGGK